MQSISLEGFYDYLAEMEFRKARQYWIGNRSKIFWVYRRSLHLLRSIKARTVLEIGVGEGYLLCLLRRDGFKVYGIDISPLIVNTLSRRFLKYGIQLLCCDISRMDVENLQGVFDAIFALDVLEHIIDLQTALSNIRKLLRPDGLFIATVPVAENPFEKQVKCPMCGHVFHPFGHVHFFEDINDLSRLLEGFRVVESGVVPPPTIVGQFQLLVKKILKLIKRREKEEATLYFIAQRT